MLERERRVAREGGRRREEQYKRTRRKKGRKGEKNERKEDRMRGYERTGGGKEKEEELR